jgi:hypothetical protein
LDIIKQSHSLESISALAASSGAAAGLRDLERWRLLPLLFKIKDKPYSLDGYPQFRELYPNQAPKDILYMCGRQVSKTTNLSRSEVLDCVQLRNFQILYVAPLQSQANRYSSTYLREAIHTCPLAMALQAGGRASEGIKEAVGDGAIIKTVGHQAFANGSAIQMMYAKTSADRARGITADRIDFDEIQDHFLEHIPVISESIANSDWGGFRRFTGTAKTCDNAIEHLWRQSSQAEWVVKCQACNHHNVPDREGAPKMLGKTGPCCGKCGKPVDVRTGELVHAKPDRPALFTGVHVPQIVVPAIACNPAKWGALLDKVSKAISDAFIYTEVFGVSHDMGARLISQEDIDKASCLGTHSDIRAKLPQYLHIVLGVDWGIAEITSFTTTCVTGVTAEGELHVLFGKRYMGMNMEEVIQDVVRTYHSYKCDICTPDFGVGFTNNTLLVNRGLPVAQIQYTRQNQLMKYHEVCGIPRWTVDRNTALTMVFWGIKHGKIKFPDKTESSNYTCDILSPYEHVIEESSGMRTKSFRRDPSKPDDFCHALTFAALGAMKLSGDSMLNLVPESAPFEPVNHDFPGNSNIDMAQVQAAMNQF